MSTTSAEPLVGLATPGELASCLEIRRRVFVEEQAIDEALELDGEDARAIHFVARCDRIPVGTARLRVVDGEARAERVAVLPEARGRGVGRALMAALEAQARALRHARVMLHAQQDSVEFYLRLGYRRLGAPFTEAGLPHQTMSKPLP